VDQKTTEKIARQLKLLGIAGSRNTVGRLLRQMRLFLRTNRKTISAGSTPDRDRQFCYMPATGSFREARRSALSVDAKKRELIGNLKNPGATGEKASTAVKRSRVPFRRQCIGIPYGIYDTQANRGSVFLRTFHEASAFAV
jgi:hypothetical protein